jgi:hypothetical protein
MGSSGGLPYGLQVRVARGVKRRRAAHACTLLDV